jgi:hypothetical protein
MTAAVIYQCGCQGLEVGQLFLDGVLVCPIHKQPTAPYEKPEQPYRGVVRMELVIEAPTEIQAARWARTLAETLELDPIVTGLSIVNEAA